MPPRLARFNKGNKFVLVVVDVLSRYIFCCTAKSKTSAEILKAFADIIKTTGRTPGQVSCDHGSEFVAANFQTFLKDNDIDFHVNVALIKASLAENGVKLVKNKLYKYMTANSTKNWLESLDSIVEGLNSRYVHSIKMRPKDVTPTNEMEVFRTLYGDEKISAKPKFKIGAKVRIVLPTTTFHKAYTPNYSVEIFEVVSVLHRDPLQYGLNDSLGNALKQTYYAEELVRAK